MLQVALQVPILYYIVMANVNNTYQAQIFPLLFSALPSQFPSTLLQPSKQNGIWMTEGPVRQGVGKLLSESASNNKHELRNLLKAKDLA